MSETYVATGEPAVCAGMVLGFLCSEECPHRENTLVSAPGTAVYATLPKRALYHGATGVALIAVLSVVTFGVFAVAYLAWKWFIRPDLLPDPWVAIECVHAGLHETALTVTASGTELAAPPVAEWIERELVHGRRAT